MRRAEPLSAAFPTPSALAVLRALSRAGADMSLRALARIAGIGRQTCAVAVAALESSRLVERVRVGRTAVVRLNEGNAIVSELVLPLLDREREMSRAIDGAIRGRLAGVCLKMSFRGVMTGVGEVLLIARPEDRAAAEAAVRELEAGFEERYGFDIRFRVFGWEDAPEELVLGQPG